MPAAFSPVLFVGLGLAIAGIAVTTTVATQRTQQGRPNAAVAATSFALLGLGLLAILGSLAKLVLPSD